MTNQRSWSLGALAVTGAALLGMPHNAPSLPAPARTAAAAILADTESWIMGGSGMPIPPQGVVEVLNSRFIDPAAPLFPGQPTFAVDEANGLFTPEGLYPFTGVKTLPLDTSAEEGRQILDATITDQIAAGNHAVVLGYSQSSTISSLEMAHLLDLPTDQQPTADQLSFVLVANPSNPDGGLLSRFDVPGLQTPSIPSLGVTFSGGTPADTVWETAIYTREYDGFADFPKYPINLLADLNALAGIVTVHGDYGQMTDEQMASAVQVDPTEDYTGNTTYWMFPSEHLPLMDLVRGIPVLGKPLADLLEPDLRVLVNLGYGPDPDIGWSTTGANVSTPFGLFPELDSDQFDAVLRALATGAQQGYEDFVADLAHLSFGGDAPDDSLVPDALDMPSFTDIVNAFSSALSSAYSALLPTADIINALVTTAPAYAVDLITQELAAGDLVDAIGLPIAAVMGLGAFAAGVEAIVVANAVGDISESLAGLF